MSNLDESKTRQRLIALILDKTNELDVDLVISRILKTDLGQLIDSAVQKKLDCSSLDELIDILEKDV